MKKVELYSLSTGEDLLLTLAPKQIPPRVNGDTRGRTTNPNVGPHERRDRYRPVVYSAAGELNDMMLGK